MKSSISVSDNYQNKDVNVLTDADYGVQSVLPTTSEEPRTCLVSTALSRFQTALDNLQSNLVDTNTDLNSNLYVKLNLVDTKPTLMII